MLRTLKDLFGALAAPLPGGPPADREHALQLATAVLLVEVMRADADIGHAERRAVIDALRPTFALADDDGARLVELAERTARDAHDLHSFTSTVNDTWDTGDKLRIVEQMWRVAYADGHLGAHEQHVLWRVADLLHVPHGAYIHAKMRARDAAAPAPPATT
jgi:uncharacterized tellurite resistance protein B-like protein